MSQKNIKTYDTPNKQENTNSSINSSSNSDKEIQKDKENYKNGELDFSILNLEEVNIIDLSREELYKVCAELQKRELEALKFIYILDSELSIKYENNEDKLTIVEINLNDQNITANHINFTFELPKDYPLGSISIINVTVKNFTPDMNNYINEEVYKYLQIYNEQKECILPVIYKVNEIIENIEYKKELVENNSSSSTEEKSDLDQDQNLKERNNINKQPKADLVYFQELNNNMGFSNHPKILARRLCYSHHILSLVKRSCIVKWAKQLNIGGYSKIGYPGIIICEGPKDEVDFYVNSLHKLKWKHFDCRGMEDIELDENENLDDARVLPKTIRELDAKGMRTLSDICTQCGLRDLFLTSMKIYNSNDKKSTVKEKNKNVEVEKPGNTKDILKEKGKKKKKRSSK
ncbi:conserved protein, unknown function [Plasmodium sp. gorilla clade G2]|uniref:conserved protein, unknown function n=1 Tax=Plasmodium sp. gorilla clade G2 TaxID=880535 RepID=UPI000D21F2D6|nr:conserved protein, unknown function [Plasmodium sp. gorilla clade G2]SOV18373.1 conserved protein, unknown function [Plasmodium sp. gorilla clade G2]